MATDADLLRAMDEPALPGHWVGWEVPLDFDRTDAQTRFDRLVERLSAAYDAELSGRRAAVRDTACFGIVDVPSAATRTRLGRGRVPLALSVLVSTFGRLTTYGPTYDGTVPWPDPEAWRVIHRRDRRLIERTLSELDCRLVPESVLELPYDGSNVNHAGARVSTWFDRYFRAT